MSKAILVAGLAYGDEGKGATVDFLCRRLPVDLVVRYNGGSQAAHNVVTPEGAHHTFSQFGSGMLANNRVRTYLSRFMLVDPLTMMNEAMALSTKLHGEDAISRTIVDPRCVVITPYHKLVNRHRAKRTATNNTCGMGVGVAREWSIKYPHKTLYADDLYDHALRDRKLQMLCDLAAEEGVPYGALSDVRITGVQSRYSQWIYSIRVSDCLPSSELTVFEGAQGVLLDEVHGEEGCNTWTDCTFANADTLCAEAGIMDRFRIGCLRTYLTRHGAGPMEEFEAGSIPELHNDMNEWQGAVRTGPMRFPLIHRAIAHIGRLDCIALSHLDCAASNTDMLEGFSRGLRVPVGIAATGPTAEHREFTPAWAAAWQRVAEKEYV